MNDYSTRERPSSLKSTNSSKIRPDGWQTRGVCPDLVAVLRADAQAASERQSKDIWVLSLVEHYLACFIDPLHCVCTVRARHTRSAVANLENQRSNSFIHSMTLQGRSSQSEFLTCLLPSMCGLLLVRARDSSIFEPDTIICILHTSNVN